MRADRGKPDQGAGCGRRRSSCEKKARAADERRKRGATLARLSDDYAAALPRRPKMRGTGLPSPEYVADEMAQARLALADMEAEDMPAADLTDAECAHAC